tara:strand:- start:5595 stop:7634 length:2040 start_codon:yes stop_codon:yes gene_type:complete
VKFQLLSFLVILIFLGSCAQAQYGYSTQSKKAIKLFEKARQIASETFDDVSMLPDYKSAITELKKALNKDPQFLEAQLMIGEFYEYSFNYPKAIEHYEKAIEINPLHSKSGSTYCYLANLNLALGNYDKSIHYSDIFLKNPNASKVLTKETYLIKRSAEFARHAIQNPKPFNPINLGPGVNTELPEYYPALTVDGTTILFTRRIPMSSIYQQEDFFISQRDENGYWKRSVPMPKNINTANNEGAPTLSADGRNLVFVACADQTGSFYGENRNGKGSCDLFYAKKIGNTWYGPVNLPGYVNSGNWESQPSLSADGKTLYFVKEIKGKAKNDSDIYVSYLQNDGFWGPPQRLPDHINTTNTEESVHIHPDGRTLYFASKGHPGMGGSDLYVTRKQLNGEWSIPENLGYPINTKFDENSLMVSANGDIAYFASNREGGFGDLDIYSFELPKEVQATKTLYFDGFVYDQSSKKPLPGLFELFDLSSGERIIVSEADEVTGTFMVPLPINRNYAISVTYDNYHPYSLNFDLMGEIEDQSYHIDIPLNKPANSDVNRGPYEASKEHVFKNVFFDLNKAILRKESQIELNLFVRYLTENPNIKIELSGHTDSRGNSERNDLLSEQRAEAVYAYLIEKGISDKRITFKGYGSSLPLFSDEKIKRMNSSKEREDAHQQNRRTAWREIF